MSDWSCKDLTANENVIVLNVSTFSRDHDALIEVVLQTVTVDALTL